MTVVRSSRPGWRPITGKPHPLLPYYEGRDRLRIVDGLAEIDEVAVMIEATIGTLPVVRPSHALTQS